MLTACTANYLNNIIANGVMRDVLHFTKATMAFKISHYVMVISFTVLQKYNFPAPIFTQIINAQPVYEEIYYAEFRQNETIRMENKRDHMKSPTVTAPIFTKLALTRRLLPGGGGGTYALKFTNTRETRTPLIPCHK